MASKDTELFSPDLVFFDMEAESTDEFFTKLGAELKKRGNINDGWYDGISTREKNYPTGLHTEAAAIAIPHTDPQFIEKPYIAVIKPKTPIVFQPMAGMGDEVPAEHIFMDKEKTADILAQTTQQGMIDAITKYFE